MAILSVIAASMALATSAAVASADLSLPANGQEVCADLSTGHMGASGTSVTVTAPDGKVIVRTCVKAGSDQSVEDGAVEYATYTGNTTSVTLYGPGGKTISHWSALWGDPEPKVYTGEATVSGSMAICTVDNVDVTIEYSSGLVTETSTESQEAADAAAQAAAETAALADRDSQLEQYPGFTPGTCQTGPTEYTGEATVSGSLAICTADGANVTVSYTSGLVAETSTESQEAADEAAQASAEDAASEALATELAGYPGYTEGVCAVTPPPTEPPTTPPTTPTEPKTVAPVLPATVEEPAEETAEPETVAPVLPATVEEPETVSVPLPATVEAPANVPAGDGSSSTQVPSGAIALAGVGLVGLGASTAVILRRRSPVTGDTR